MTERTLHLIGEINADSTQAFLEGFAILDAEKGPITVQISSPGGDTQYAMAMYDVIRSARNKVTTLGLGMVGSAAVLVLAAGRERVLSENAVLYLHETAFHHSGAAVSHLRAHVLQTERLHKRYCALLAKHAGWGTDEMEQLCSRDGYLDAEVAVASGFADVLLVTSMPRERSRASRRHSRALVGRSQSSEDEEQVHPRNRRPFRAPTRLSRWTLPSTQASS